MAGSGNSGIENSVPANTGINLIDRGIITPEHIIHGRLDRTIFWPTNLPVQQTNQVFRKTKVLNMRQKGNINKKIFYKCRVQ